MYLTDIVKSSNRIYNYTVGISFNEFLADQMRIDAVARNLEIIGEAVKNISPEIRERHPEIEWQNIGGLRNILAHGYFKVDNTVLWRIVQNDVPLLQSQMLRILELEGIENPLILTETEVASTAAGSTDSAIKSIYPKQRERAAVIIPIARSLLKAGREPNTTLPIRESSLGVEELEIKDYKLTLDNQAKTLAIAAIDGRKVLIKVKLEEQTENLELAGKITPKDVKNWLQIKQDLDKRL